jgi:Pyruvate/2-oxoacid:ferredoxin oxidoreductase gamma subunit
VVLSVEAYSRYQPELGEHGRLIVDDACAPPVAAGQSLATNISRFAVVEQSRSISGGQLASGVVALGVLQAFSGVVEAEALREAVATRVPARHKEMNLRALEAGMQLVGGVVV